MLRVPWIINAANYKMRRLALEQLTDHLGSPEARAVRAKASKRRNYSRMVATDVKLIRSVIRRDSSYGATHNAGGRPGLLFSKPKVLNEYILLWGEMMNLLIWVYGLFTPSPLHSILLSLIG